MTDTLFNGRFLTRPATGVDRFAIELMTALAQQRHGAAPLQVAVPAQAAVHDAEAVSQHTLRPVGRHAGQRWEQFDLPHAAGSGVLVNLCNTAPLLRQRQLVVIHDLGTVANAGNYGLAFRSWYRLMHGAVMRRAHVVATVSRFSADALVAHHGRRSRGLEVISEGGEHILRPAADTSVLQRLQLQGRRYVLAVGTRSPNKNFRAVVQAMRMLDDPGVVLVGAGGGDARVFAADASADAATGMGTDGDPSATASAADRAAADARVKFTGYVSNGELRALYENAACFAFPSFYEGFGLPPLEAMCCGCPVIVSDRASLPEVCGDAALYCKADDPQTLAAQLRKVLGSESLARDLREAGSQRAQLFGWDKAAIQFQQLLDANFA